MSSIRSSNCSIFLLKGLSPLPSLSKCLHLFYSFILFSSRWALDARLLLSQGIIEILGLQFLFVFFFFLVRERFWFRYCVLCSPSPRLGRRKPGRYDTVACCIFTYVYSLTLRDFCWHDVNQWVIIFETHFHSNCILLTIDHKTNERMVWVSVLGIAIAAPSQRWHTPAKSLATNEIKCEFKKFHGASFRLIDFFNVLFEYLRATSCSARNQWKAAAWQQRLWLGEDNWTSVAASVCGAHLTKQRQRQRVLSMATFFFFFFFPNLPN